ncbi:MAG: hypothetical protein JXA66_00015 [Oligoflexia bacterium]|nr:hypothetical protein [Oligoflexia bacterium]
MVKFIVMKKAVAILIVVTFALYPSGTYASKMKEIGYTAAYGVLAGTIVGVASLAFSSNPGSHLRNIAVGASLGLYAGILLGVYLAYGVKLEPEVEKIDEDEEDYEDEDEEEEDAYYYFYDFSNMDGLLASQNNMYTDFYNLPPDRLNQRQQQLQGKSIVVPLFIYNF